ncbi:ATP-grasp domain-containing protein [Blastocladiella britannica]|nr:ATP-grasp domain-containing protein [Blastocladiella britannica]
MTLLNILVLDDLGTPSLTRTNYGSQYSSFASAQSEVNLFIITSKGALHPLDAKACKASAEIDNPTTNGTVELLARAWHEEYGIHAVYTRHEDMLIRAAGIRRMLGGLAGMSPESALAFRDKALMKQLVAKHGVPVPHFARIATPSDLLQLADRAGLPLIVKPVFGSASAGIQVLRTRADLAHYLATDFFGNGRITDTQFDAAGDLVGEAMLNPKDAPMVHVNGLIVNGKIQSVWVFAYIATNFGFTKGKSYGNVSLCATDSLLYKAAVRATQQVLDAYTAEGLLPSTTAFHCELFQVTGADARSRIQKHPPTDPTAAPFLVLCEIAARRPGGSITPLMDATAAAGSMPFAHAEFRAHCGLPMQLKVDPTARAADLLVPHVPHSVLTRMPDTVTFPGTAGVRYIPTAGLPSGKAYAAFAVGTLNTVARFVVTVRGVAGDTEPPMSREGAEAALRDAEAWFARNVEYRAVDVATEEDPAKSGPGTTVVKTPRRAPRAVRLARAAVHRADRHHAATHQALVPPTRLYVHGRAARKLLTRVQMRMAERHAASAAVVKYRTGKSASGRLVDRARARVHHPAGAIGASGSIGNGKLVFVRRRAPGMALVRRVWIRNAKNNKGSVATTKGRHPVLLESAEGVARRRGADRLALVPTKVARGTGPAMLRKVQKVTGANGGGDAWMQGKRAVMVVSPTTAAASASRAASASSSTRPRTGPKV